MNTSTPVALAERALTLDQQKRLDTILNKTFLDLAVYSLAGYGVGIGLSIFFKQKSLVKNFAAGIGGSYGFAINKANFNRPQWFLYPNLVSFTFSFVLVCIETRLRYVE